MDESKMVVRNKFTVRQCHNGGDIWVLTIDNPPLNLLTRNVFDELGSEVAQFEKDQSSKVLIITGGGERAFIGGVAIDEIIAIADGDEGMRLAREVHDLFSRIECLDKPVLAAINGLCMGGGNELALACHYRIASETAKFSQPEISLGFIPGFGATQRLPRLIGSSRARKLIMTGESIRSEEALKMGLVDMVVPDGEVVQSAMRLATKLAEKGQIALRTAQRAIREGLLLAKSFKDGLEIELECFKQICDTEDMKEGLRAFKERRKPDFKHR